MNTKNNTGRKSLFVVVTAIMALSAAPSFSQILKVASVMVDSVWNSDSSWYDGNGILQQRTSRDCKVSFIPQGEGMARMFIALSIDSGKTWDPSSIPLTVLNNGLSSTFMTNQKSTVTIRILSGDKPGVAFKMTARQATPVLAGNPKTKVLGITPALMPGSSVGAILNLKLASETSTNGFCTIAKIYWDALGNGTIDDSTTGATALTWTWFTQVPAGASGQKRGVIARAIDKNGLWSAPETLAVQFGLLRPIVMKNIAAGTFSMGDASIGVTPVHQVTVSAFAMQETDVTQEQYLVVMGYNPSKFQTGDSALLRPVESVSWYEAVMYCNTLSKLSDLDTCYTYTQFGATDAVCNFTKSGYRLPTEAQWEYASRAGSTTTYWWGADSNGIGARAWWKGNSNNSTQPVATKLANAWGLYDMAGNVWQWCNDWYGDYTAAAVTDPTGAATGTFRVLRGGSWINVYVNSSSAARSALIPNYWVNLYGFRVALPR